MKLQAYSLHSEIENPHFQIVTCIINLLFPAVKIQRDSNWKQNSRVVTWPRITLRHKATKPSREKTYIVQNAAARVIDSLGVLYFIVQCIQNFTYCTSAQHQLHTVGSVSYSEENLSSSQKLKLKCPEPLKALLSDRIKQLIVIIVYRSSH